MPAMQAIRGTVALGRPQRGEIVARTCILPVAAGSRRHCRGTMGSACNLRVRKSLAPLWGWRRLGARGQRLQVAALSDSDQKKPALTEEDEEAAQPKLTSTAETDDSESSLLGHQLASETHQQQTEDKEVDVRDDIEKKFNDSFERIKAQATEVRNAVEGAPA